MQHATVGHVGEIKRALAEATRTDEANAARVFGRFVEPRGGILASLEAARAQLLTGRRGTGKSTLLLVLRKQLEEKSVHVLYLDMQKYDQRPYPDVLVEVVLALMESWKPNLHFKHLFRDLGLRRERMRLMRQLDELLLAPQVVQRQYKDENTKESKAGGTAELGGKHKQQSGRFHAARNSSWAHQSGVSAEYEEEKIQRLHALSGGFNDFYRKLMSYSDCNYAVVFLDDFYFVPYEDQPMVLGYLHGLFKGAGIHLKVGGVLARLNPYREGRPPQGMEIGHDISRISLDVTLENFATAKRFLEEMLQRVLGETRPIGELFTDSARDRMVLVCGGAVARDYITLLELTLDETTERLGRAGHIGDDAPLRIIAEDVQKAARGLVAEKEEQAFSLDSGKEVEGTVLKDRWRDLCDFARESKTRFILVPNDDLKESKWGDEVQTLENLRLLHKVGTGVPNTAKWNGRSCAIYMLDLGQQNNARLTTAIPEFWTGQGEFDKLRRAQWVYEPAWKLSGKEGGKVGSEA